MYRDLSCTSTSSFNIRYYSETDCDGHELNGNMSTIDTGCQHGNFTSIIDEIFPNNTYDFSSNQTYFEITECGGAWPEWATIIIIVGSVLCCCCCCGVLCYCFSRQRKGGLNQGLVQTYGETNNYS